MAKPFIFGYHRRPFRLHRTLSHCLAAIDEIVVFVVRRRSLKSMK